VTFSGLHTKVVIHGLGVQHKGILLTQVLSQKGILVSIATLMYITANPGPETVTETVDTQHIEKP